MQPGSPVRRRARGLWEEGMSRHGVLQTSSAPLSPALALASTTKPHTALADQPWELCPQPLHHQRPSLGEGD